MWLETRASLIDTTINQSATRRGWKSECLHFTNRALWTDGLADGQMNWLTDGPTDRHMATTNNVSSSCHLISGSNPHWSVDFFGPLLSYIIFDHEEFWIALLARCLRLTPCHFLIIEMFDISAIHLFPAWKKLFMSGFKYRVIHLKWQNVSSFYPEIYHLISVELFLL